MDKNNSTCAVDVCEKPVKSRGYCYGHYMKWWRYGTTHPNHERARHELAGREFGELTAIKWVNGQWLCACSCGVERRARSYDLLVGAVRTCGDRRRHLSSDVCYGTAHERVRKVRGSASQYPCVDCGRSAAQWSYDHADGAELVDTSAGSCGGLPYSIDPAHYDPRCVSCHKRFDLSRM